VIKKNHDDKDEMKKKRRKSIHERFLAFSVTYFF